jgi:hypothetical protein
VYIASAVLVYDEGNLWPSAYVVNNSWRKYNFCWRIVELIFLFYFGRCRGVGCSCSWQKRS